MSKSEASLFNSVQAFDKSKPVVAVVGAGIAGLAAASKLHAKGFDVVILEALDRVGGRVHTIPFADAVLELGAQWVHGQGENPLYELAVEKNLVSNPEHDFGVEGEGLFCTDTGEQLDSQVVREIISYLNEIKEQISSKDYILSSSINLSKVSAGQIFKEQFQKYILLKKCSILNETLLWAIFTWYMKFEMIDNACHDLEDLSLRAYCEWFQCKGVQLVNLRRGYQSLIDSMLEQIPASSIRLNSPVENISVLTINEVPNVKLKIKKQSISLIAHHVIVTSSIGFLRKNHGTFFTPKIPENKAKIIELLGFGTINKIFLEFDTPFWQNNDIGFQLIWTSQNCDSIPSWAYDISGFDIVRGQTNVLLGWIGGQGAEEMERVENDQTVGEICVRVLRLFLPNFNIPQPSKVIRSKWASNEYVAGAYSHRSLNYEKTQLDLNELANPILSSDRNNWPCILFAGEATDRQFYSTTHGALRSGWREAQRIIEFWEETETLS